eukprot:GEMP01033715.1.p1 GENE.GEMP01033715.1~~GEMP01033715.1.p1  ORF type:complete len:373 (+),score=78.84 GEMP01033715.1:29-1120(+)
MCVAKVQGLFVVAGCLATLVVGVILVGVSYSAMQSKGFMEATHVVMADTQGDGDGMAIELDLIVNVIMIAGVVAIVTAMAGLVGACRHSKTLLCSYSIAALLFGAIFLASGVGLLMVFETLGPQLREHVNRFCTSDVYSRLLFHLKNDYNDPNCGDVTNALATVNMPTPPLSVPTTAATARLLTDSAFAAIVTNAVDVGAIRRFLAGDTAANTVTAADAAAATTPAAPNSNADPTACGPTCKIRVKRLSQMGGCKTLRYMCTNHHHSTGSTATTEKEDPAVVCRFEYYLKVLILSLIGFGHFLLLSMACTCFFMYTLGTGKQGKKGGQAFLSRLFCSCFRSKSRTSYEHKRLRAQSDDEYDVE